MEKLFTLEFSEKQNVFHHNYGEQKENTNGFITIYENCSDLESIMFQQFLDSLDVKHLCKKYIIRKSIQFADFINELKRSGIIFKIESL